MSSPAVEFEQRRDAVDVLSDPGIVGINQAQALLLCCPLEQEPARRNFCFELYQN